MHVKSFNRFATTTLVVLVLALPAVVWAARNFLSEREILNESSAIRASTVPFETYTVTTTKMQISIDGTYREVLVRNRTDVNVCLSWVNSASQTCGNDAVDCGTAAAGDAFYILEAGGDSITLPIPTSNAGFTSTAGSTATTWFLCADGAANATSGLLHTVFRD